MIDIDPRLKQLITYKTEEVLENTGFYKKSFEDLTYERVNELDKGAARLRYRGSNGKKADVAGHNCQAKCLIKQEYTLYC